MQCVYLTHGAPYMGLTAESKCIGPFDNFTHRAGPKFWPPKMSDLISIQYYSVCTMRRHISRECKDIALHMSLNEKLSDKTIRRLTGISERAMKRLRRTFCETGELVRNPEFPGRPCFLDSLNACVSCSYHIFTIVWSFQVSWGLYWAATRYDTRRIASTTSWSVQYYCLNGNYCKNIT